MAFIEEISEIFKLPFDQAFGSFSVLLSKNAVAIENVVKIHSIASEQISVSVKGGRVEILGEKLEIVASGKGVVYLKGKISKVELI